MRLLDLSSLRRLGLSILDVEDVGCLLSVLSRFLLASSLLLMLLLLLLWLTLLLPLVSVRRLVLLLLLLLLEVLSLFSVDVDAALVLLAVFELGELVLGGGGGGAILISTGGAGSSRFRNLFLLTHFSL